MKSPFFSRLLLGFLLLFALSASAARLESDRDEIAVGEIVTINLKGAPFIALVEWKVSPELEVIESDDKHVRVRGIQPGAGMVTCEMNLSVHKRAVRVSGSAPARRPDDVRPPPPPVMPPPPPVTPPQRQTPPGAVAGIWQITSEGDSGYLELRMDRGILIARLRMDSTNQWEDMQDVRFDGAIDELSFSRPATNQSFRGQYRGESLHGRTSQWGGRGYSGATPSGQWSASRGGLRDVRRPEPPTTRSGGLIAHLAMTANPVEDVGRLPVSNNGARPTRDRFGREGGALLFDGRAWLELPLDINPGRLPHLTIAAWVRADADQPIQQIVSHDNGGYDRSLGIDYRGGGNGWSAFAGSGAVLGVKPVQTGKWTFVAAVWDQVAQRVQLYADGQHFEKAGSTGDGHGSLRIGMNPSYGEHFRGAIDEVWIFDEVLDANAIAHLRGNEPSVAQPAIRPHLSIERGQYAPGEAIVVSFTAPASYANDAWIGIIPSAIPHGSEAENDRHDLTYQYLQKRTGGSLSFNAPTQPGDYDFRMHDTDSNGREVASVSFRVGAPGGDGGGRGYTADRPHDPGPASDRGSSEKEIQELMNQLRGLMGR